jgi:hypothetical protein
MKIHYSLDDSAARLPLAIRSAEGLWDRAAELRSAPGVRLVELTTQHMLNTGTTLADELANYYDTGAPGEDDPYALVECYAHRDTLEDLLHDLRDAGPELVAFEEVEMLFPPGFTRDLSFTLALTAVGFPAFGYVRSYRDSEGEEFHGMVVNLAQARPHLERTLGQFSFSVLLDVIRYSFFNHEGFQLAYNDYSHAIGRVLEKPIDRLKNVLLSRGIAWYLGYRHNLALYDQALGLDDAAVASYVARWKALVDAARRKGLADETVEDWLHRRESRPDDMVVDIVGYHAARAIAARHSSTGLREAIALGPDHFIALYNALGEHILKG